MPLPLPTRRSSSRKRSAATRIQASARAKKTRKQYAPEIAQMYRNLENKRIENQCPICHESMINNGPITKLQRCRDRFHTECLTKWLKTKLGSNLVRCPVCSTRLSIQDTLSLQPSRQTQRAITQQQVQQQLLTSQNQFNQSVQNPQQWLGPGSLNSYLASLERVAAAHVREDTINRAQRALTTFRRSGRNDPEHEQFLINMLRLATME
jgi:hypothetical protein